MMEIAQEQNFKTIKQNGLNTTVCGACENNGIWTAVVNAFIGKFLDTWSTKIFVAASLTEFIQSFRASQFLSSFYYATK